jgi:hypothetical protein
VLEPAATVMALLPLVSTLLARKALMSAVSTHWRYSAGLGPAPVFVETPSWSHWYFEASLTFEM